MAITNTGTIQNFNITTDNSGTVSTTIDAADAELVIVGISGYSATDHFFSSGGMTFTKGGVDTAMTSSGVVADSNSLWMAAAFYLVLPDTGANKTLTWNWAGVGTATNAPLISVSFWKGIDTTSPVRDADGAQASSVPFTTPTLTCVLNDMIVAWTGIFSSPEGSATGWTNVATLADCPANVVADGAWATGSPSGDTAIALTGFSNAADGGLVAIVLKPAAAPPAGPVPMGQVMLW